MEKELITPHCIHTRSPMQQLSSYLQTGAWWELTRKRTRPD